MEMLKDFSVTILRCRKNFGNNNRKLKVIFTALIVVVTLIIPVIAVSEEAPLDSNQEDQKIHIKSDRLILNSESKYAEFIGNTHTTQGDTVITADILKVFYNSGIESKNIAGTDEQSIKKIIAKGNVKIHFDERDAEADQAVYTTEDRVLVLSGDDAKISSGDDFFTGEKIILHRDDGRIIFESGKGKQVGGLIHPKESGLN